MVYRESQHLTKDQSTFINISSTETEEINLNSDEFGLIDEFNSVFWEKIYPLYSSKYPTIDALREHKIIHYKIQKTLPSEGYHIWHPEQDGSKANQKRLMSWMLYLNDVKCGGETEFLYQSKRFTPKENTFLLWPAGYTHTHRGNPPLKGEKYVMTGWVEFI